MVLSPRVEFYVRDIVLFPPQFAHRSRSFTHSVTSSSSCIWELKLLMFMENRERLVVMRVSVMEVAHLEDDVKDGSVRLVRGRVFEIRDSHAVFLSH